MITIKIQVGQVWNWNEYSILVQHYYLHNKTEFTCASKSRNIKSISISAFLLFVIFYVTHIRKSTRVLEYINNNYSSSYHVLSNKKKKRGDKCNLYYKDMNYLIYGKILVYFYFCEISFCSTYYVIKRKTLNIDREQLNCVYYFITLRHVDALGNHWNIKIALVKLPKNCINWLIWRPFY